MKRCTIPQPGYIYLIKADTGHHKIGCTKNLKDRMNLFAVKLPFKFEVCRFIQVDDMYKFEKWMHWYWEEERVNGEWFKLSEIDLDVLDGFETQQDIEEFISWIQDCRHYHNQPYVEFFR